MKQEVIHYTKNSENFIEGENLQQYINNSPESFSGECFFCYKYSDNFPVYEIAEQWNRYSWIILEIQEELIELEQIYPGDDNDEFASFQDEYIIKIENFNKAKIINVV